MRDKCEFAAIASMSASNGSQNQAKGHRRKPKPLGQYLTRWNAWFRGGLQGINLCGAFLAARDTGDTGQSDKH